MVEIDYHDLCPNREKKKIKMHLFKMFTSISKNYRFRKPELELTFDYSLKLQIIIGIVSLVGLTIKLKKEDYILYKILLIETIVQFVEFFWYYIFYHYEFNKIPIKDIASKRYQDWYISTPIMLLSTALFMQYTYEKEKNLKISTLKESLSENYNPLIWIGIFNALMLFYGQKYEQAIKEKKNSKNYLFLGFLFFFLSFGILYNVFAFKSTKGTYLFYFVFGIWILYGFAATQRPLPKNIYYNILDIISKNFYGIYILYEIYQNRVDL